MKKILFLLVLSITVLLSACQKEASMSPLLDSVPAVDTTTVVSDTETTIDTTETSVLSQRVSINYNLNLTNFKYVSQANTMVDWKPTSKYDNKGYCEYPRYIGKDSIITTKNNLCGPAAILNGMSLVIVDSKVGIPSPAFIPKRLSEFQMRYQKFDASYDPGEVTQIKYLRDMLNGTSSVKGELTNWSICSEKIFVGATLVSYPKNDSSSRASAKSFIRNTLKNGKPLVILITINASKRDAYDSGYIVTNGSGTGHMVTVVGVTEDDINNVYQIRFKDPFAKNSKTYVYNYSDILNSMIAVHANYNLLAIYGR